MKIAGHVERRRTGSTAERDYLLLQAARLAELARGNEAGGEGDSEDGGAR